jgi:hypothetical protein
MLNARNLSLLKQLLAGTVGILTLGLTAQAQIYDGSISFVGGAVIDNPIPNATTFTSFYGPGGPGSDPVVQGGQETGQYAPLNGGNIPVAFTPFTFSPSPAPFQLWSFTYGTGVYSFDITSVQQPPTEIVFPGNVAFLNVGGDGEAIFSSLINAAIATIPATWSITGTTANSAAITITIGSAVNTVPEPPSGVLAVVGLLVSGVLYRNRLKLAVQRKA